MQISKPVDVDVEIYIPFYQPFLKTNEDYICSKVNIGKVEKMIPSIFDSFH